MEREYGEVSKYLTGQTVYVIGGGPSLVDFDFSVLMDENMIGANDAGRLSGADTVVTLDKNYYRHRREDLAGVAREGRTVYAALPNDVKNLTFPEEIVQLRFKRGLGLSQDPGMIYGLNSGFAAFNVAYLAGATDIRLLGFDFKFTSDRPHWHEEHPWFTQKGDHQIRRWAKDFDTTVNQLEASGVKVTNYVGPQGSAITAFKTKLLEDLAA